MYIEDFSLPLTTTRRFEAKGLLITLCGVKLGWGQRSFFNDTPYDNRYLVGESKSYSTISTIKCITSRLDHRARRVFFINLWRTLKKNTTQRALEREYAKFDRCRWQMSSMKVNKRRECCWFQRVQKKYQARTGVSITTNFVTTDRGVPGNIMWDYTNTHKGAFLRLGFIFRG